MRGPEGARVTIVEYGDFQCPYCAEAYPAVAELLRRLGDEVRFVFRHMPLTDLHPAAQRAAEAAEAAGAQGMFWEMHDRLFEERGVGRRDLAGHAKALRLDVERFERELDEGTHRARVEEDLQSGLASGVPSTPRFYVDGVIHLGSPTVRDLEAAIGSASVRE